MNIRIKKLVKSISPAKLTFLFVGGASVLWFLIRVIPKPGRAAYPCMRASAPIMSAFVLYLIGLFATVKLFKGKKLKPALQVLLPVIAFSVIAGLSFRPALDSAKKLVAENSFIANSPIGIAQGIIPGRVAWVYNPRATNEKTKNSSGDFWYMDQNTNQAVVDSMLTTGIMEVAGKETASEGWDALFRYFNLQHGKGDTGYQAGEKVAIKINLTNSCCNSNGSANMDAAPQLVLSILKQLVEIVGVPQADIWIGDNYRAFRDEYWEKCHSVYPGVHYVDGTGGNGREKTIPSDEQLLQFSDGQFTSSIPQHYVDAAYLINIPCLKSHDSAGITLAAKNHQGSILKPGDQPQSQSAFYMHYCLPVNVPEMGQYRHLVDYMGHKHLGGKTLIYIVDALWGGKNWNGIVEKWKMAPFSNDYPSSLFLSQDAVAIESVGYDFLLAEYKTKPDEEKYPYMNGTDDYLMQAADPANWPVGINYDPEGDGTYLGSLGVYEHWNNAADKKYSLNLGMGTGIDLHLAGNTTSTGPPIVNPGEKFSCYPNPFSTHLVIKSNGSNLESKSMKIYTMSGMLLYQTIFQGTFEWNASEISRAGIKPGTLLVVITDQLGTKILGRSRIEYQPGKND
jgi:hypothetical protein